MNRITLTTLVALAALCPQQEAAATSVNIRSVETLLSAPNDMAAKNLALWAGSATQRYEYNMPFIELANEAGDLPISTFRMTIGDTNFVFSNEFRNKMLTNSAHMPANGEFALLGMSTPGIGFSTRVSPNRQELFIDFDTPLAAGQTVRFQVDIDRVAGANVSSYAPYTDVFFKANGGPNNSGNSLITLDLVGAPDASLRLPNFNISESSLLGVNRIRPYNIMQMAPMFPDGGEGGVVIPTTVIPEPSALVLVVSVLIAARRR